MQYDELLNSGKIHREKVSRQEINRALTRAERDLKAADKILNQDWDWCFAIAYNAVLQASRAYMFAQGYRPSSSEGHKNTLAFMRIAMAKEHEELILYFDRMRVKRNQAIYDLAGMVSETEAKNLLSKSTQFVRLIKRKLSK